MKRLKYIIAGLLIAGTTASLQAREIKNMPPRQVTNTDQQTQGKRLKMAGCEPASASADLNINNVRTTILNGGDMWWDLSNPKYEIPKINDATSNEVRKHSLFAGAIWLGGLEGSSSGPLKIAAMTYRQRGSDFWPGPLDTITANTEATRCARFDQIYQVTREEIEEFVDEGIQHQNVLDWPGSGDILNNEAKVLAPFFDANKDGFYIANSGDYPVLSTDRPDARNKPKDQPDQMLFYVYNDKGDVHNETNGIPIGVEIRTTAFAFSTQDEVNNMTFYTSLIVNRGFTELVNTYFGQWVDPDLGNFSDDYVGCDVGRSLGMCYNGDNDDNGVLGYGLNPPSIGVDFFEGPIDQNGTELGLSKFVYYNNDFTVTGNPNQAIDFYNYLQGRWKNGSQITRGGNGFGGSTPSNYMFPFDTDPAFPGDNWNEKSAGNTPADRRFLQTSGPFTLLPGAVNKITVGVVWARTTSGGAEGSLELLKLASDKAQKLFENQFDIIDGPDAPDIDIKEYNQKLVITFTNTAPVENYTEIEKDDQGGDLIYKFQGYRVYQLADATVGTADLDNQERAREIFQCDVKDNVVQLINKEFDPVVATAIPRSKVIGNNEGIVHTIELTNDAFATSSNTSLVNFKTYYYLVLSYAYLSNDSTNENDVQYLPGRNNVQIYRAIPHQSDPKNGGTTIQSDYGDGPEITRIEGTGNGGNFLELTEETVNSILAQGLGGKAANPTYKGGAGPVNIKVIDPLKVPVGDFQLRLKESNPLGVDSLIDENTTWELVRFDDNGNPIDTVYSDTSINYFNEQTITGVNSEGDKVVNGRDFPDWGLSVGISQAPSPGDRNDPTNGYIGFDVQFQDNNNQWLTAWRDDDQVTTSSRNWIRAGNAGRNSTPAFSDCYDDIGAFGGALDPFEVFEDIWDGRIAPYELASRGALPDAQAGGGPCITYGPAYRLSTGADAGQLKNLYSVDLVITPDKSKWTRCVVVEMGEDATRNEGGRPKFAMRAGASRGKNGEVEGTTGRSWFPGYAINVETGERLNIMFGEDSRLDGDNGKDMLWNPTSNTQTDFTGYVKNGGKHYIYIMGSHRYLTTSFVGPIYDGGEVYATYIDKTNPAAGDIRRVMSQAIWVIPTFLNPGYSMEDGVPPSEVSFKLRVKRPYAPYVTSTSPTNDSRPLYKFNTRNIAAQFSKEAGENAIDLINIVPNPYYAYSAYESSALDTRVKITNLPPKCEISIYTLDGTLVRRIKKDDDLTYVDWNLKNQVNVPIASGLYIIHIDAGELGEKVLKWFGVMRTQDLDTF